MLQGGPLPQDRAHHGKLPKTMFEAGRDIISGVIKGNEAPQHRMTFIITTSAGQPPLVWRSKGEVLEPLVSRPTWRNVIVMSNITPRVFFAHPKKIDVIRKRNVSQLGRLGKEVNAKPSLLPTLMGTPQNLRRNHPQKPAFTLSRQTSSEEAP